MDGDRQRILRATAGALSWQPQGADGEPADPGDTVTVGVTSSDGTVLVAAGTATDGTTSDPRTVALTVEQTQYLDLLTATWTVGTVTAAITVHEIVGGYYFTTGDLRGVEPSTSDAGHDTKVAILRARSEFETMVEQVCGVAFVPRFTVSRLIAGRWIVLPRRRLRAVRWIRLWTYPTSAPVPVPVDVATYPGNNQGLIDLGLTYCDDDWQVEIAYEHGYDAPPEDLKRAALTAVRSAVNASRSGVPDRATSIQLADGGVITLATPGVGRWHTGIPTVDEVINRYAMAEPSIA